MVIKLLLINFKTDESIPERTDGSAAASIKTSQIGKLSKLVCWINLLKKY